MFKIYSGRAVGADCAVSTCQGKLWPRTLSEGITLGQYVPPGRLPKESIADIIVHLVCSECGLHHEAKDAGNAIEDILKPQIVTCINLSEKPSDCSEYEGHEKCREELNALGYLAEGVCRVRTDGVGPSRGVQLRKFLYCRRLLEVLWVEPL